MHGAHRGTCVSDVSADERAKRRGGRARDERPDRSIGPATVSKWRTLRITVASPCGRAFAQSPRRRWSRTPLARAASGRQRVSECSPRPLCRCATRVPRPAGARKRGGSADLHRTTRRRRRMPMGARMAKRQLPDGWHCGGEAQPPPGVVVHGEPQAASAIDTALSPESRAASRWSNRRSPFVAATGIAAGSTWLRRAPVQGEQGAFDQWQGHLT